MSRRPSLAILAALALSTLALSGCAVLDPTGDDDVSNDAAEQSTDATTSDDSAAVDGAPSGDVFPTCAEVKTALGGEVADFVEPVDGENGVSESVTGTDLICAFLTPETRADNLRLDEYGAVSVSVGREPTWEPAEFDAMGWLVEDARAGGAGAWVVKPGGGYSAADQLDAIGIQVVRDGTVVVLTVTGAAVQKAGGLPNLTNDWAVGAGLSVLGLMR